MIIPWLWSLTLPSDTIWTPTNRTLLSLAFCLGIKDSYHAGPAGPRRILYRVSLGLQNWPASDLALELSMRELRQLTGGRVKRGWQRHPPSARAYENIVFASIIPQYIFQIRQTVKQFMPFAGMISYCDRYVSRELSVLADIAALQ